MIRSVISYKAADLCQGADEDLLLVMGDIVFPGLVSRRDGENGLWLSVNGTTPDERSRNKAEAQFRTLLGVLRAWRSVAGELVDERRGGLGQGAARDAQGNQWLSVGPAIAYAIVGGEDRSYAENAASAIKASPHLRNALWLNGRTNRTAADFYMIYDYAKRDLDGSKGITARLGISGNQQGDFTQSANHLSPLEGGRHLKPQLAAPWTLAEQQEFIADMLRRWIAYRDRKSVAEQGMPMRKFVLDAVKEKLEREGVEAPGYDPEDEADT
jgi:hypothetical protein